MPHLAPRFLLPDSSFPAPVSRRIKLGDALGLKPRALQDVPQSSQRPLARRPDTSDRYSHLACNGVVVRLVWVSEELSQKALLPRLEAAQCLTHELLALPASDLLGRREVATRKIVNESITQLPRGCAPAFAPRRSNQPRCQTFA